MQIVRRSFTYEDANALKNVLLRNLSGPFDESEEDHQAFADDAEAYMALRRRLRNDSAVSSYIPQLVRKCHDLEHALEDVRNGGTPLDWRNAVRSEFVPLLDWLDVEDSSHGAAHDASDVPSGSEGPSFAGGLGKSIGDELDTPTLQGVKVPGGEIAYRQPPVPDQAKWDVKSGPLFDAEAWTGLLAGVQRLHYVKALFPSALNAVNALILELEKAGGNGGPTLDDRAAALEVLRSLRNALGTILELADNGGLESGEAIGLFGEASSLTQRLSEMFADDPLRCGLIGMSAAMASLLSGDGVAVAGMAVAGALSAMVPPKR